MKTSVEVSNPARRPPVFISVGLIKKYYECYFSLIYSSFISMIQFLYFKSLLDVLPHAILFPTPYHHVPTCQTRLALQCLTCQVTTSCIRLIRYTTCCCCLVPDQNFMHFQSLPKGNKILLTNQINKKKLQLPCPQSRPKKQKRSRGKYGSDYLPALNVRGIKSSVNGGGNLI